MILDNGKPLCAVQMCTSEGRPGGVTALAESPAARELLAECERLADAHQCVVFVTTRDDDPEQPLPFGVWGGPGGAGGLDLIGAGHSLSEALDEARAVIRGWV